MNNFIDDFTKPIERSDRAHAEYVPTQVVTEYFRHVYRTGGGAQLDGIISSASMAKSLVICGFIDQPTTWRENKSSTTAKYSQPSYVHMFICSYVRM